MSDDWDSGPDDDLFLEAAFQVEKERGLYVASNQAREQHSSAQVLPASGGSSLRQPWAAAGCVPLGSAAGPLIAAQHGHQAAPGQPQPDVYSSHPTAGPVSGGGWPAGVSNLRQIFHLPSQQQCSAAGSHAGAADAHRSNRHGAATTQAVPSLATEQASASHWQPQRPCSPPPNRSSGMPMAPQQHQRQQQQSGIGTQVALGGRQMLLGSSMQPCAQTTAPQRPVPSQLQQPHSRDPLPATVALLLPVHPPRLVQQQAAPPDQQEQRQQAQSCQAWQSQAAPWQQPNMASQWQQQQQHPGELPVAGQQQHAQQPTAQQQGLGVAPEQGHGQCPPQAAEWSGAAAGPFLHKLHGGTEGEGRDAQKAQRSIASGGQQEHGGPAVEARDSVTAASGDAARALQPVQPGSEAWLPAAPEAGPSSKPSKLLQHFDYLVVYDLEATCDEEKKLHPQEIIELSCVVVNTRTMQLEGRFQEYCRPDIHPRLTDFCTQLTGITQQQVEAGISLEAALGRHTAWLKEQGLLGKGKTFVPVTWTEWDLQIQMDSELKRRKLPKPKYLARWVNLKAVFIKHYNTRCNLKSSVEHAGLTWEGRAHSTIYDAVNTARLAVKLMQRGLVLGVTGSFTGVDASGKLKQSTLFPGRPAKKAKIYDDAGTWNGKCSCGVKAKKRMAKRPGANNGKEFWSCGKYTVTGGAACDFFKWLEAVN